MDHQDSGMNEHNELWKILIPSTLLFLMYLKVPHKFGNSIQMYSALTAATRTLVEHIAAKERGGILFFRQTSEYVPIYEH